MAASNPTNELLPSSEAAKVAAKSAKTQVYPAYFRAGGFALRFEAMFNWMKRVDHEFYKPPPRTDVFEVWDFAEEIFPRELCLKVLLLGDLGRPGPFEIFFATRAECVAPSVISADLPQPVLDPLEMQGNDLAMRDWLRDTARESDGYIAHVHDCYSHVIVHARQMFQNNT